MGEYGTTSTVEGWTKPKRKITDEEAWKQVWQAAARSNTVNVPQVVAEFYLLEIISAHVGIRTPGVGPASDLPITAEEFFELLNIRDEFERQRLLDDRSERLGDLGPEEDLHAVRRDALLAMTVLVDTYMPTFYEYLNLAIGGEIRHHMAGGKVLDKNRPIAWCDWQHIFEEHGVEAIRVAASLFREFPSRGGYGGEPWAQAAEILAAFLDGRLGPDDETNRRLFMDRVWTLEHNNGCILNKVEWVGLEAIQKVLNAHAANPPDLRALYRRAGEGVQALWERYSDACNTLRDIAGEEPVVLDLSKMTYYGRCNYCSSNVEVGHALNCMVHKSEDFDGGKFDQNVAKSWYGLWDDEMIEDHGAGAIFNETQLPITPQGTMSFDSGQKLRYKVTLNLYDDAWNTIDQYTTGFIHTTWGEMLNVDFDPTTLIPATVTEIYKCEFRLSAYIQTTDGEMRIAQMYQHHPQVPFTPTSIVNLKDWMRHCTQDMTIEVS
jgi:hypothetical protein